MWKEIIKIIYIKNLLKNMIYPLSFTKLFNSFYTKKNDNCLCKIQFYTHFTHSLLLLQLII